jgi:hypothetical protein
LKNKHIHLLFKEQCLSQVTPECQNSKRLVCRQTAMDKDKI